MSAIRDVHSMNMADCCIDMRMNEMQRAYVLYLSGFWRRVAYTNEYARLLCLFNMSINTADGSIHKLA